MSCTIEQQAGTLSAAVERDDQDTESDKCSATMFDSQYEHELVEAVGNHATMRMSHSSYRSELTYALDEGPRFSSSGKTTAVADIAGRSVEEVDVSVVTESPDLCHIEQGAHGKGPFTNSMMFALLSMILYYLQVFYLRHTMRVVHNHPRTIGCHMSQQGHLQWSSMNITVRK